MDWKNIGETLLDFAPALGGMLLGPAGAAGGQLLAKTLGVDAEPEAVMAAINSDPEALTKIYDLNKTIIEQKGMTTRTMLETEAVSKHTTRPKIAYQAFQVVSFISVGIFAVWAVAVLTDNSEMVNVIQTGWPFVVGIILPYVGWLNAYFGILADEQKDKLNAINGMVTPTKAGLIGKLLKTVKLK